MGLLLLGTYILVSLLANPYIRKGDDRLHLLSLVELYTHRHTDIHIHTMRARVGSHTIIHIVTHIYIHI